MRPITLRASIALALGCAGASAPTAPVPPAEYWVYVETVKGEVALRVGNGPPRQETAKRAVREGKLKWVTVPDIFGEALSIDGGTRVAYTAIAPDTFGPNKPAEARRYRLMVADAEGKNPKAVFTGIGSHTFGFSTDGTSAVCAAEKGRKWDVYRIPFDGTRPIKLSRTSGIGCPHVLQLSDGRVAYWAITGWHVERPTAGTTLTGGEGPVLLTDGRTETVLVKKTRDGLPTFSADACKMAVRTTVKGEAAVEVTDLKTGATEAFPVSAFKKGWACGFGKLRFSPDGRTLAVTFGLEFAALLGGAPLNDEAFEHVGVAWLDGRENRVALYHVEVLRQKHKEYPLIQSLEWGPPPVTK